MHVKLTAYCQSDQHTPVALTFKKKKIKKKCVRVLVVAGKATSWYTHMRAAGNRADIVRRYACSPLPTRRLQVPQGVQLLVLLLGQKSSRRLQPTSWRSFCVLLFPCLVCPEYATEPRRAAARFILAFSTRILNSLRRFKSWRCGCQRFWPGVYVLSGPGKKNGGQASHRPLQTRSPAQE